MEMLLLKVVNDLLMENVMNRNHLDGCFFSAAFDTVDQMKLLEILQNNIGIKGTALKWFKLFLMERNQRV